MRGPPTGEWMERTKKEIYEYLGRPVEDDAAQNPHHAYRDAELHSEAVDQNGDCTLNERTHEMSALLNARNERLQGTHL